MSVALALSSAQSWAWFSTSTSVAPNLVDIAYNQWKDSADCTSAGTTTPTGFGTGDNLYLCGGSLTFSTNTTLANTVGGSAFTGTIGTLTIDTTPITVNAGITLNASKFNLIAVYPSSNLTINGSLILAPTSTLSVDRGTAVLGSSTLGNFKQGGGGSGTTSLGTSTIAGNLTLGGDATGTLTLSTANTVGGNVTYAAAPNIVEIAGTLKFSGATTHTITNASGGTRTIPNLDASGMAGGTISVAGGSSITFSNLTAGKLVCGGTTYTAPATNITIASGSSCSVPTSTPVAAPVDLNMNKPVETFATEIEVK